MTRIPYRAAAATLAVATALVLQSPAAGKDDGLQGQFTQADRMLTDTERACRGEPVAAAYVSQARQVFNKAWADYNSYINNSASLWNPGQFRPYDSFGYKLKRDANGRLVPLDSNPADLAARAEAWSKQMSDMLAKIDAMRTGDQAALSKQVDEMMKSLVGGQVSATPAAPDTLGGKAQAEIDTLSGGKQPETVNPYANDPNVVDLRDSKTLTPQLLRSPEAALPASAPAPKKKEEENDLGAMLRHTDWPKDPAEAPAPRDLTAGFLVSEFVGGDSQERAGTQIFVDVLVDATPVGKIGTARDGVKLTGQIFDLGGRISDAMTSGDVDDWRKVGSGALSAGDTALGLVPVVGSVWTISKWMVEPPPPVIGR